LISVWCFVENCLSFPLFLLTIPLSSIYGCMVSQYLFDIFKLWKWMKQKILILSTLKYIRATWPLKSRIV
jgi:hypothetical protein